MAVLANPTVSVMELAMLFHGHPDGLDKPCPSKTLALAICEQVRPAVDTDVGLRELLHAMYALDGTQPADRLPEDERDALAAGYAEWRERA